MLTCLYVIYVRFCGITAVVQLQKRSGLSSCNSDPQYLKYLPSVPLQKSLPTPALLHKSKDIVIFVVIKQSDPIHFSVNTFIYSFTSQQTFIESIIYMSGTKQRQQIRFLPLRNLQKAPMKLKFHSGIVLSMNQSRCVI